MKFAFFHIFFYSIIISFSDSLNLPEASRGKFIYLVFVAIDYIIYDIHIFNLNNKKKLL